MIKRAFAVAVLGSLILLVSPAPAFAHAELLRSNPRNGSVVAASPRTITLTFGEGVTMAQTAPQLTDASGAVIPVAADLRGPSLDITPSRTLRRGPATVTYHVLSEDGHEVAGAVTFVVRNAGPRGSAVAMSTTPAVPTTLNGRRPGQLTVSLARPATSGQVVWTSPNLAEPITWRVTSDGNSSVATGVLPRSGPWQMAATLQGKGFTVLVVRGSVTLSP